MMNAEMVRPEMIRVLNNAAEVARIALAYDYEMPSAWTAQTAATETAQRIADEPEPTIPLNLPAAGKLPAFVSKVAAERDAWRNRTAVAGEIRDRSTREAARIAYEHAPQLAARLATESNEQVMARLVTLLDSAPYGLTGHEDADALAAYSELLRTIGGASRIAYDLAALAIVTGESADLGRNAAFLLINPGPNALISAVDAALKKIADNGFPTTLDDWRELRPLGLQFGRPGEAGARSAAYFAARANLIGTPDGGMAEHTIGELAAMTGNREAAQRVAALSR